MDELTLAGKTYVSSKRAAEITGYAKDYVGQLCREGHVEARMVGRSWYVLESSIREHRFGPTVTSAEGPAKKEEQAKEFPATWSRPTYVSEPVIPSIPELTKEISAPAPTPEDSTIADMQSAWKEWFQTRNEPLLEEPGAHEARLESPEVIEEREEGQEQTLAYMPEDEPEEAPVEVAFSLIPEPPPLPETKEEAVPIRKIAPVRFSPPSDPAAVAGMAKPLSTGSQSQEQRAPKSGGSLVTRALLVAFCAVAISVGVIGSGFGSSLADENPIVRFLGGTSTIQK
jgi:hypothetical protein